MNAKRCPTCGSDDQTELGHIRSVRCRKCMMVYRDENVAWLRRSHEQLAEALRTLLGHYCAMINSGDCGNWNPETDSEVVVARDALALAGITETPKGTQ